MNSHFFAEMNRLKTSHNSPKVPQFMWTSVETLLPKITSPLMGGNLGGVLGTFGESGLGKISNSIPVVSNGEVVEQFFRPMGENCRQQNRSTKTEMNFHLNTDKSVAVATNTYWLPMDCCPKGV